MAVSVNCRGQAKAKEANAAVQWLKTNKKVTFVERVPTGFKVGLNEMPAARVCDKDEMTLFDRDVVMVGMAVRIIFSERIAEKYDLMYSQRAFVHWYVDEGMEEGEEGEQGEKDYLDVLPEQTTDEVAEASEVIKNMMSTAQAEGNYKKGEVLGHGQGQGGIGRSWRETTLVIMAVCENDDRNWIGLKLDEYFGLLAWALRRRRWRWRWLRWTRRPPFR